MRFWRLIWDPGRSGLRWIIAGVVVATVAGFAGAILTARGMMPSERGLYLQFVAVAQIAALVSNLGLTLPITSIANGSIPVARDLLQRSRKYVWPTSVLVALASGTACVALIGEGGSHLVVVGIALVANGCTVLEERILIEVRVAQDFVTLAIASSVPTLSSTAAIALLLISDSLSVVSAFAAYAVGPVLLLSWLVVRWVLPRRRLESGTRQRREVHAAAESAPLGDRQLVRLGLSDLLAFGPTLIAERLPPLVIGAAISPAATSVYNVATAMATPQVVLGATVQSYFGPRVAAAKSIERRPLMKKASISSFSGGLVVAFLTILLSFELIPILYGDEYSSAILPGGILALGASVGLVQAVAVIVLRVVFRYRLVILVGYGVLLSVPTVGFAVAQSFGISAFAAYSASVLIISTTVLWRSAHRHAAEGP